MSSLTFTYGVMGSSKSAQALITRFNYMQKGINVILAKPSIDNRGDSQDNRCIRSRIGLSAECVVFDKNADMQTLYDKHHIVTKRNVMIIDEAQFCTTEQINQLKSLSKYIDVHCYGLKTNFRSELFEGSKRLVEIADTLENIPHICRCGNHAIINARMINGVPTIDGEEIHIAGDESYEALCYDCWQKLMKK